METHGLHWWRCLVTLTALGIDMVILVFPLDHKGGP